MNDPVRTKFLEAQLVAGLALAKASGGILELVPIDRSLAPDRYMARFAADGLALSKRTGQVEVYPQFVVGVRFPEHYLHNAVHAPEIVTVLDPHGQFAPFHPNMHQSLPYLCPGHLPSGTQLVDILWQVFEMWTWHRTNFVSVLNPDAAEWGRHHSERYPVDRRPLARKVAMEGEEAS